VCTLLRASGRTAKAGPNSLFAVVLSIGCAPRRRGSSLLGSQRADEPLGPVGNQEVPSCDPPTLAAACGVVANALTGLHR
jgi:hypothetical protein